MSDKTFQVQNPNLELIGTNISHVPPVGSDWQDPTVSNLGDEVDALAGSLHELTISTDHTRIHAANFSESDGGWSDASIDQPGTVMWIPGAPGPAVPQGVITVEQTGGFGVGPCLVANVDLAPDLPWPFLERLGRFSISSRVTLDSGQGSALDASVNQAGLVLVGDTVGGALAAVQQSAGDGLGDADVIVLLENPDSPLGLTPVALGKLSTLTGELFLRLEIVQSGPQTFTAICYCEGEGVALREVLRVEGLLLQDYGYHFGVTPYLLSLADTEAAPHVHTFDDVVILSEPGPVERTGSADHLSDPFPHPQSEVRADMVVRSARFRTAGSLEGWTGTSGSPGSATVPGSDGLHMEQTAGHGVGSPFAVDAGYDEGLDTIGRIGVQAKITMDETQDDGATSVAGFQLVGDASEFIAGYMESIGDGAGGADVTLILEDSLGAALESLALGTLLGMGEQWISVEIERVSATQFVAAAFRNDERVLEIGPFLSADYGLATGCSPRMSVSADTADPPNGQEQVFRDVLVYRDRQRALPLVGSSRTYRVGDRAEYATIQAAVDAAEAAAPTVTTPACILIPVKQWDEDVVIRKSFVHLQGMVGQGACRIRSVTYTNATAASIATYETSDDPADLVAQTQVDIPSDNQIRDLEVWNQVSNAQAGLRFLGAGAGTSFLGNELLLVDVTVRGSGPLQDGPAIDGVLANYFSTGGYCWIFGEIILRNVAGFWPLGAQLGAVTVDYQAAAPYGEPADNGNYGISGKSSYFTGAVVMTNEGRIGGDPALSHRFESTITATGTGSSTLKDCSLLDDVSLGAGTAMDLVGGVLIGTVSGAGTFTRTPDTDYAVPPGCLEIVDTTLRTTTAAAYEDMGTLTLTPGAGEWIAFFSAELESASAGVTAKTAIVVDGVVDAGSEQRTFLIAVGSYLTIHSQARITTDADDVVKVQWYRLSGGSTINASRGRLHLVRVSAAN